jgi:hypothetical protein
MNDTAALEAYLARENCGRMLRERGLDERFFLKAMMRRLAIRTNLSRITLISLFFNAPDAAALSIRDVWAQLEERLGAAFEIRNLYGALRRIEASGILCATPERSYYLSALAVNTLCQLMAEHEPTGV